MISQLLLENSATMGLVRTVAITVLSISFFVFIALFGRLPVFRKTPIGFLHRLIMVYVPHGCVYLDQRFTGGRITRSLYRSFDYLMNEPHPLVLIFFVLLQLISEILFIPPIIPLIPRYPHVITMPIAVVLPYATLYLSYKIRSTITPKTHTAAMHAYPYDYVLYHPNITCKTCHFTKPARSKHCSICKACMQRQDHHCIWINNCVGRNNYVYFVALLLTIAILLLYAATLGFSVLNDILQRKFVPPELTRGSFTNKKWSTRLTWREYIDTWSLALAGYPRIGGVTLLAALTFPLATAFLIYHVYIMWAGMTTNESSKWSELREDIDDHLVWKAPLEDMKEEYPGQIDIDGDLDPGRRSWKWKTQQRQRRQGAEWWIIRTRNGAQPRRQKWAGRDGETEPDFRWRQVSSLKDVDNIYDLGFLANMSDALFNRG